jgi:hypothetical protein
MTATQIVVLSTFYVFFALGLFGHFLRHEKLAPPGRRVTHVFSAAGWPIYFLVNLGPGRTAAVIGQLIYDEPGVSLYWLIMFVSVPVYLYGHWATSGAWCIPKAILWAPIWPLYAICALIYGP